ncbi:MAG: flavodoxin family protein [Candidatus Methanoplasma sp.]|jgi:multimeric flavodoxin WrbA|nr:flavodoxin family protein [Candidatus Methanoplasma sp.]
MTIVAIVASPRIGANSDTLTKAIAKSAEDNGKTLKFYRLNTLKNVKGCQACGCCKKKGVCAVSDDQTEILEAIKSSEGLILSTPLYFGAANAQFRLLQDRFYSFMGADFKPFISPGKKLAVVVTCGGGKPAAEALAASLEEGMKGRFGFSPIGSIVMDMGNTPSVAANNADALAEAERIGKKF